MGVRLVDQCGYLENIKQGINGININIRYNINYQRGVKLIPHINIDMCSGIPRIIVLVKLKEKPFRCISTKTNKRGIN